MVFWRTLDDSTLIVDVTVSDGVIWNTETVIFALSYYCIMYSLLIENANKIIGTKD